MPFTAKFKLWLKHHIRKLPMLEKALRFLMAKFLNWKHQPYRRPLRKLPMLDDWILLK